MANGQIEFQITSDGKGEYRKKGADTWSPFKSDILMFCVRGSSLQTVLVDMPDNDYMTKDSNMKFTCKKACSLGVIVACSGIASSVGMTRLYKNGDMLAYPGARQDLVAEYHNVELAPNDYIEVQLQGESSGHLFAWWVI